MSDALEGTGDSGPQEAEACVGARKDGTGSCALPAEVVKICQLNMLNTLFHR